MTWDEMADAVGVKLCLGILPTGHYCDISHKLHRKGIPTSGIVHWSERPKYRSTIRSFLMAAAQARMGDSVPEPKWRRVYRLNQDVLTLARKVHVRLPAEAAAEDRAYVLSAIVSLPADEPDREAAYRWAHRYTEGGQ